VQRWSMVWRGDLGLCGGTSLQLGMGSPARKSRAGPGLHVGPGSGLISEPEHRAGLGSGLQKTRPKPSSGWALSGQAGLFSVRAGFGPD
jgi:hypothetical protein